MRLRMLGWLSHRQHEIGITVWLILPAGTWWGALTPGGWGGYGSWVWIAFYFTACALLYVAMFRHRSRLCSRCIDEVPLDGPDRTTRRRRALRFHHQRFWVWVGVCAGLITSAATTDYQLLSASLATVVAGTAVASEATALIHRPLEMWCPWCRDPGDDGGAREPTPDPAGQVTA